MACPGIYRWFRLRRSARCESKNYRRGGFDCWTDMLRSNSADGNHWKFWGRGGAMSELQVRKVARPALPTEPCGGIQVLPLEKGGGSQAWSPYVLSLAARKRAFQAGTGKRNSPLEV